MSLVQAARHVLSYHNMSPMRGAAIVLMLVLLRILFRYRAGNFARGQHARTRGLPAMHLNGVEGMLASYHPWRGLWSFRRHNGAIPMVRPGNLERIA